jgi:hypothetical protein
MWSRPSHLEAEVICRHPGGREVQKSSASQVSTVLWRLQLVNRVQAPSADQKQPTAAQVCLSAMTWQSTDGPSHSMPAQAQANWGQVPGLGKSSQRGGSPWQLGEEPQPAPRSSAALARAIARSEPASIIGTRNPQRRGGVDGGWFA